MTRTSNFVPSGVYVFVLVDGPDKRFAPQCSRSLDFTYHRNRVISRCRYCNLGRQRDLFVIAVTWLLRAECIPETLERSQEIATADWCDDDVVVAMTPSADYDGVITLGSSAHRTGASVAPSSPIGTSLPRVCLFFFFSLSLCVCFTTQQLACIHYARG